MRYLRLIIDIVMVVAVMNGWWFVILPLGIIATWKFPYFIEIILAGICYDALFGMVPALGIWSYSGTLGAISVVLLVFLLKKLIR